MTPEEIARILSEDYADLIVEYYGNPLFLERFQNATVQIFNDTTAIIYVPISQITGRSISLFGYSSIPDCYGLVSTESIEASGIRRLRNISAFNLRGQGVLVGIVDTGIDYTNPVFLHEDGTTRIISLWDQTINSTDLYPDDTFFGTEYKAEQINLALRSENPYDIVPSKDEIGHGTMLAGIAAGNDDANNGFFGVATEADLVVVKLRQAKSFLRNFYSIPENAVCYQENHIMWGVRYLLGIARQLRRPIAICIGIGTSQGAHDGLSQLSAYLSIVADFPGVAIVAAVGNEGNDRRHFFGEIDPVTGFTAMELNVGENEKGFTIEIWGETPGSYSIDILTPSGEYTPRIQESIQVNRDIAFVFESTTIAIDYQMVESATGDQLILMRFKNPSAGVWRFQVYGRGDLKTSFHAWLPMNGFISDNTYFVQSDPYTTITAPGTATVPISITAYNPINESLYLPSGRGYTRQNTIKPELAAPGVNYIAPTLNHEFKEFSGTSVAAAHTAGIVALMLEWGIIKGNYTSVDSIEIKKFLLRGAKRSEGLNYPNRDWGYGIIDIYNTFDILRTDTGK